MKNITTETINNYFVDKANREKYAKEAELREMVNTFGIDNVLDLMMGRLAEVNKAIAEVVTEEEDAVDATKSIPASKYQQGFDMVNGEPVFRPRHYSERTEKVFTKVLRETGTTIWAAGSGEKKCGKIGNPAFARFIIESSGNKPDILTDVITILQNSAWDMGNGITQAKMELVYHVLALHKGRRDDVVAYLTELLKNYDFTALKVTANQRDEYRNHLNYVEKMTMFAEDYVCERIGEKPKFARELGA